MNSAECYRRVSVRIPRAGRAPAAGCSWRVSVRVFRVGGAPADVSLTIWVTFDFDLLLQGHGRRVHYRDTREGNKRRVGYCRLLSDHRL